MSEAGERMLEGAREAVAIAKGEQPAASIMIKGHRYVPEVRWQPIETAPRDGTTILLYAPGWDSPKTGWTYGSDEWQDCPFHHRGDPSYRPTHWMPLPEPPPSPTIRTARNERK